MVHNVWKQWIYFSPKETMTGQKIGYKKVKETDFEYLYLGKTLNFVFFPRASLVSLKLFYFMVVIVVYMNYSVLFFVVIVCEQFL